MSKAGNIKFMQDLSEDPGDAAASGVAKFTLEDEYVQSSNTEY